MKISFYPVLLIILFFSCGPEPQGIYEQILKRNTPIHLDGIGDDEDWSRVEWKAMDQIWLGELESSLDFNGRYKMIWDDNELFVLVETVDDTLIDIHEDPLVKYWDDDCLEIFIDEDNSKDIHQYNHSAFAYHIGLDGNVADIGPDSLPHLYNDNLTFKKKTLANLTTWELAIKIYGSDFIDGEVNKSKNLIKGKNVGFAIAYCDNDRSEEREAFIGSEVVVGDDKNRGWIDSGIFRTYVLEGSD